MASKDGPTSGFSYPDVTTLDGLVALLHDYPGDLYLRWSRGPDLDLTPRARSADDLTGLPQPGLSATALAVEDWWQDRPLRPWAARRLSPAPKSGALAKIRGRSRGRSWPSSPSAAVRGPGAPLM
jgi:hypothetical protein